MREAILVVCEQLQVYVLYVTYREILPRPRIRYTVYTALAGDTGITLFLHGHTLNPSLHTWMCSTMRSRTPFLP